MQKQTCFKNNASKSTHYIRASILPLFMLLIPAKEAAESLIIHEFVNSCMCWLEFARGINNLLN